MMGFLIKAIMLQALETLSSKKKSEEFLCYRFFFFVRDSVNLATSWCSVCRKTTLYNKSMQFVACVLGPFALCLEA